MTFQWSAEFGGVLKEIRSEFGRSYAVMQKRARCNGRHCEEESVSMDNGSRGCTASGRPSRELGKSLISRCMKRRIVCSKARDLLREQCFPMVLVQSLSYSGAAQYTLANCEVLLSHKYNFSYDAFMCSLLFSW
jgi:hypothetical protein